MTEPTRSRARTGYTHVDPDRVIHIDRPSNFSLRVVAVVAFVLATLAGAILPAVIVALFDPAENVTYLIAAAIGAALAGTLEIRTSLHNGRRRREDFVRSGGDPTGMTDLMFGAMRGWRTADGRWEVTPQGSGDYI